MAFEFKFPDVGEGIHEGKVIEWLVKEGDHVETDQPFVKIETDKAVVELPVRGKGHVIKLLFAKGETIKVGEVIAVFGEKGEKESPSFETRKQVIPDRVPKERNKERFSASSLATPHTRSLARKLGVDLAKVSATGKNGRITDEDVENARKGVLKPEASAVLSPSRSDGGIFKLEERVELSHLRKVIAGAMIGSKRTSAHVTHVDEADVTNLAALYQEMKSELQKEAKKITLMPFFIKALVQSLKEHPKFNGSVDEEKGEFIFKRYYNIGFAADTEEGLIVPVIKNADRKNLLEISEEAQDLAAKARYRTISLEDIKGATCTVTNIGPLGGVFATPIIHQPELSIVGFHAIRERPWAVDGDVKIRKIMYVSVSFDHKYIDGAEAARFMSRLVHLLEKPSLILAKG